MFTVWHSAYVGVLGAENRGVIAGLGDDARDSIATARAGVAEDNRRISEQTRSSEMFSRSLRRLGSR